jgi:GT2 family glycosyltransferase/glycosyltransferase involved in cell wall biosynthesis
MRARATPARNDLPNPVQTTRLLREVSALEGLAVHQSGLPAPDGDEADRIAALHRARFLRPLCTGRLVALNGGGAAAGLLGDVAASMVTTPGDGADVVLALDAVSPQAVLTAAPELAQVVRSGGVLVMVSRPDATPDGGRSAIEAALARRFRYVATFRQSPVVGTLLTDARREGSRVVALADDPTPAGAMLHVCSAEPLPDLAGGVFAAPSGAMASLVTSMKYAGRPVAVSGRRAIVSANPVELPEEALRDENALELRRRAVSLVERLIEHDERMLDLVAETAQLRRQLEDTPAPGDRFDVTRTRHGWPLADNPEMPPEALEFYDRRVDDDVVLEGRAGEAFLKRFGLTGDAPATAAAIAALNAAPRRLPFAGAGDIPDVSIVIPVHGQLGYTLNCLDSLFRQASRHTAEIIVIDDDSPDGSGDKLPLVAGIRCCRQPVNGGFISSCNAGATLARGRILVMLNNDTRVVAGWLDELIGGFTLFPRAGLVGSKLLYPDGSLQEAGGIIWRDGSAWNYGRNDDPNRPQYCHARQVDFVSGASIAVPAALWHQLGGFDALYAPAYNEDSDLCFRIRAAGHETWFQPQSKVIHYEGRTAGTDTRVGVKSYQVVNARKFLMRWHETLADHRANGEAPYFERERRMHRRALVIDATAPTPDQDAGSVTTVLNLRLLQQLGYKVHFVPQDNFLFQQKYITDLQREGIECAYVPYDTSFESYMSRYGSLFDVMLVFRVTVAEKTIAVLRRHAPQASILFNNMDLHFLRLQREAELAGDAEGIAAAAAMQQRELDVIGKVDCTITPSTFEKGVIAELAPAAPARVLPFMFDFAGTSVGFAPRRDICFLGGYRHSPNVDAVRFFVREVFPLLRQAEPGIRFVIAGANPTPEVKALATDDVIVTGMVADLRAVFDTTRVFACPLRAGAGVKGKLATAMSYGLPVVTTSIGAEGMDLRDGEHVLVADTPAAFAASCLRAYRDAALWQRLSAAGQALVRENHSLVRGRGILAEAIETALRHRLGLDTVD